MPWMKHRLRDADVWAKVDDAGVLVADRDGRVEIVYKPAPGAKVYRAGARNLTAVPGERAIDVDVGGPAPAPRNAAASAGTARTAEAGAARPAAARNGPPPAAPEGAIQVWTDGACTGNPGPAGLGVVLVDGAARRELSEYLGDGTNNIAELSAILRGLQEVPDRSRQVIVYSDSEYSIGLLTKNWKPKKNVELIGELRALCATFPRLSFVKVAGHAGIPLNERTDQLARDAITRGR